MPGAGGHRFEFVGKEPLIFRVLVALLIADTFVGLFGDHLNVSLVRWWENHFIAIQFALLASIAGTLLLFRKRVRYIPPRSGPRKSLAIAIVVVMLSIVTWVVLSNIGWLR